MIKRENSILLKYKIILYIHFILQARGSSLNCTFEVDICEWNHEESDHFDWRRWQGGTKTGGTGPKADHTTGGGFYIYFEANRRAKDDIARITSPMQEPGPYCLTFWYSMYGNQIGALNVYMQTDAGKETVVFTKNTNVKIPDWKKAVIGRNASTEFKIVIEGVQGNGKRGDIAVDDISMTNGLCLVDCNFESGLCQWVQDDSDDFDWTWHNGTDTGPQAEHTSGPRNYIYIDKSETENGDEARIISPWQNSGNYCFVFWYYMYGAHVKTLTILKDEEQTTTDNLDDTIIKITRQHRDIWIQEIAFIHSTIGFRGNVENYDEQDLGGKELDRGIALDDVQMLSCQDCDDPTPRNGKSNCTNFQYSSVIKITCNVGYYITGNSSIECQAGGTWSGNPTCEPVDCDDPTPRNGKSNCTNFQYSSVIKITCNVGYYITGNSSIECQAGGTWSGNPTCEPVDCDDPTPRNGKSNCTNFQYSSVIKITCNVGYYITGNSSIECQAGGTWSGNPTCEPVDTENNTMIAVYVLVPVAAVAIVVAITIIIWRYKAMKGLSAFEANQKHDKKEQPHSGSRLSNETYSDHQNKLQSNTDCVLSEDTEYDIVMDDGNRTGENEKAVYYNTADAMITEQEKVNHNYDHAKLSQTPVLDNNYSHLSEDKGSSFESCYNTTSVPFPGKVSFQTDTKTTNNNYGVLNLKTSKQSQGKDIQSNMLRDQDPEYDHAKAGGINPVDSDDYSHLNDKTANP